MSDVTVDPTGLSGPTDPADLGVVGSQAMSNRAFGVLSRIGRSLMLPVATLPAGALLLRFGQEDMLGGHVPHVSGQHYGLAQYKPLYWLEHVANVMNSAGGLIFSSLPLLFCLGVAVGFARRSDGSTAIAALVGYLTFDAASSRLFAGSSIKDSVLTPVGTSVGAPAKATLVLSVSNHPTGVLGGICVGLMAALLWQRYHRIRLPTYLAFFGGRRFVPIVAAFAGLLLGVVFSFIWPPLSTGVIKPFGNWMSHDGTIGAGVYGFANRLLVPFGLHHILNSVVWYVVPTCKVGTTVASGDQNCYFIGHDGSGTFMAGFFPVMMFGLVGAAVAMWREAKVTKRKVVGGIMISAALTSFLTGVTEPIEYAFVFVAPELYVIHAVLTGCSMMICSALGIKIGFGFSAGFLDYALNFHKANTHNPLLVLVVGVVYFFLYYFVFRFVIRRFNVPTPGREADDDPSPEVTAAETSSQPEVSL
ncbi:MAG: N-acetylglucosamine system or component [Actinomycetota bacterium]|jgi:PTS system N-acetylglucosamine-specific IIC component|nr:N-acetylglucosamine system or component [Actinomycetota bacterium]MDQ1493742.1 N-acetylglucosamine system or component [Actinomycetota bacterium]